MTCLHNVAYFFKRFTARVVMPGFQTEMFVEDLALEFKCAVCLLGLKEPVQTTCGHRFCRQCIRSAIRFV